MISIVTIARLWFQRFFMFTTIWGRISNLPSIFQMGGSTTKHIGSIGTTLLSLSRSSYQDSAPHGPQVTLRRRCSAALGQWVRFSGSGWHIVCFLGGGNSNMFYFHPYLGRWSNLTNIFQVGWKHQLVFIDDLSVRLFHQCIVFLLFKCFCGSRSWANQKVKFAEADAHLQIRWDWPCPTKSLRESRGAVQNPQIYPGSDSYYSMFPAFLQMCHSCMWIDLPLSIYTTILVDTCILSKTSRVSTL